MTAHNSLNELFTEIADAIREKSGGMGEIIADNFPEEIKKLGGSESEDALISTNLSTYTNGRVTEIAANAFSGRGIDEFTFPNVLRIHARAFEACSFIKISCPKLVYIDDNGFHSAGRTGMEFDCRNCGYVGSSAFGFSEIRKFYVRMSKDETGIYFFSIGDYAFENSQITHLVVIDTGGNQASARCNLGYRAFNNTPIALGTGYIYVPRAFIDSYKAAENWSTYASQFRALEDYTVDGTVTGELDESKI